MNAGGTGDKVCLRPLIPLLTAFICGIVTGDRFPDHRIWAWGLTAVSALAILVRAIRTKHAAVSVLSVFFCCGYLSIQPWAAPFLPADHIARFADGHLHQIAGTLHTAPVIYEKRTRFVLQASNLDTSQKPVGGLLRVTAYGPVPPLSVGDKIIFFGKLRRPRNFGNPGGFDYERYLAFKGIRATTYVRKNSLRLLEKRPEQGIFTRIEAFRHDLARLIREVAPGDTGEILCALIIGDKSGISDEKREKFQTAGIAHLLAISGLHMGIVATVSFVAFHWLLSRFTFLLWRGWPRKGAALLSLVPVLVYALISGMSPSAQRAFIMTTAVLTTCWVRREADLTNILAVAAIIILAVHPPALFSVSFQLSFAAVLSIVCGFSKLQQKNRDKKRAGNRLKTVIVSSMLASIFAILGTLPLTMYYFNRVSFAGIVSNLIFIWLIGFGVVPLGLFFAFLYPFSHLLAGWGISASAALLSMALTMLPFFSALPLGNIQNIAPSIFEICCYYLLGWALLNLADPLIEAFRNRKRLAVAKWPRIIVVLTIFAFMGDALWWMHRRFWHEDLRVTVLDVGQGSCALAEFPGGTCMLIDGGGFYDNAVFDVGERLVAPFLWRKKIGTVDTLLLSHPDADHLNGLLYIAEHFNVRTLWTNGVGKPGENYKRLMEIVDRKGIHVPEFSKIPRLSEIGGVRLALLYPSADFMENIRGVTWQNKSNNTSLVVKIEFNGVSILFPGDIEAPAEAELTAAEGSALKSTILIAPHHGSKTSSTPLFLDHVRPEIAITSSGFRNRFNCPHPSVIRRYKEYGCRIFRTDRNGAISISSDGKGLTVRPFVESAGIAVDNSPGLP